MKGVFYIVFLFFISIQSLAQNLVTNPGFEAYTTCPTAPSQFSGYCSGWIAYTNGTPEYYNSCNSGSVGVPFNINGSQAAAAGNAYAGIIDYANATTDFKEYITTSIMPLQVGATYEVSIMVSLADNAAYASNGLGVYFFHNMPASVPVTSRLTVSPQITYASYGPITNKTGWTKLTKTFVADSAYDNIVIGGFLSNVSIQTTALSGTLQSSYYYIDSVSVKFADTVSLTVNDTLLCVGNTIQVPYAVNAATPFSSGNTFTLQLSDNLGSFAAPLSIGSLSATTSGTITGTIPALAFSGGTYRMRIVASNPAFTSRDNGRNIGIGNAVPVAVAHITSPVCENDTFTINVTASTSLTDAIWNGPKFTNSHASSITVFHAQVIDAGLYTVTAFNYGCMGTASNTLTVNSGPPDPIGISNTPVCSGDTLMLSGQTMGSGDTWQAPNGTVYTTKNIRLPNISVADSGMYILSTMLNGCAAHDTINVNVKASPIPGPLANSPCEGSTLNLSGSYTGPATKYKWSGPSGYNSLFQNNEIMNAGPSASGKYYFSITAPNGCIGKDSIIVKIKNMPGKTHATGFGTLCEKDTLQLQATNDTSNVIYAWTGPGGFSTIGPVVVVKNIASSGSGKYIVTADLDGCNTKDSINVTVKHRPENPLAVANTPLQEGMDLQLNVNNIESGATYSWIGPLGFTASAANTVIPAATKQNMGTYIVTASENGCSSSSLLTVTIDARPDSSVLMIYPNPSNGNFSIKSSVKVDQKIPIHLYNDRGSLVYKTTVETHNRFMSHTVLMRDALAGGVYILHMIIDGESVTERIVIKR